METYTWSSANPTTASGNLTVTATNNAGLTSSGSNTTNPFTMVADSTAPTGGAVTVNGTPATTGGSSSYINSGTTLTLSGRTNYTETQSPTLRSGLEHAHDPVGDAVQQLLRHLRLADHDQRDDLADSRLGQLLPAHLDRHGQRRQRRLDHQHRQGRHHRSVGPDAAYSSESNVAVNGTYVYYRPGATSGSFTVTASSTDSETGIASYSFPSLGSGWTATPGSLGVETYTWSSANPTTASGNLTVTATNNAGLTSSGSNTTNPFTMVADSTAPTGGAVTVNGTPATTGGSSSYINSGTTLTLSGRTNYTETQSPTQSGLASSTLTIQSATLSNNSCGTFGSPTTISGTTSQTVASGNCYLLTLTGTDNVGNAASIISTVKVDTTAPWSRRLPTALSPTSQ